MIRVTKNIYIFGNLPNLSVHDYLTDRYYNLDKFESYILLSVNGSRTQLDLENKLKKNFNLSSYQSQCRVKNILEKFKTLNWITNNE
ncbi:MAG: hypothetical protein N4Q29_03740 [Lactobacillus iners]|uniref:hypothetical protein n=1 Tax=Lactobacillus iners TaxID=147802 RepID=UPI001F09C0A2|nr:hypothetical protein [Lactobacillus iners]MCT7868025.1 hypothetical protein [Lactobacillus iners]